MHLEGQGGALQVSVRAAERAFRFVLLRTMVRITIVILIFAIIGQYIEWQSQVTPVLHINLSFLCPDGTPLGTCGA
jgi:hypothetical protein